jgi:hypothetical protein
MTTTISGSNGIVFPDATSMQTGQQAVKAWVNFNGVGTVAIRASYNVSSVTDNGTGRYTVNFTTAMTDANYAVAGSASFDGSTSNYGRTVGAPHGVNTDSAVGVITSYVYNSGAQDFAYISVTIFR